MFYMWERPASKKQLYRKQKTRKNITKVNHFSRNPEFEVAFSLYLRQALVNGKQSTI